MRAGGQAGAVNVKALIVQSGKTITARLSRSIHPSLYPFLHPIVDQVGAASQPSSRPTDRPTDRPAGRPATISDFGLPLRLLLLYPRRCRFSSSRKRRSLRRQKDGGRLIHQVCSGPQHQATDRLPACLPACPPAILAEWPDRLRPKCLLLNRY